MLRSSANQLAAAAIVALLAPDAALAKGQCALVNVGLLPGFSEPERRCFRLDITCPTEQRYGCFKGALEFHDAWIEKRGERPQRRVRQQFGFIDPDGVHWDIPEGAITDGASIPLFFQPLIGGPWTENFVKAATLHDFYIRRATASAAAVHNMFYLALLAAGTSPTRAALMHTAVVRFGPQWKSIDVSRVDDIWRARKASLDELTRLHQQMWEAHQDNERRRARQEAADRALLSRPLEARTRVYVLENEAGARRDLDTFIDGAVRDGIVLLDRDASLIASLREQLETELRRPVNVRDNVFVLRFMRSGATTSRFAVRSKAELGEALALDARISTQLDGVVIDGITGRR